MFLGKRYQFNFCIRGKAIVAHQMESMDVCEVEMLCDRKQLHRL